MFIKQIDTMSKYHEDATMATTIAGKRPASPLRSDRPRKKTNLASPDWPSVEELIDDPYNVQSVDMLLQENANFPEYAIRANPESVKYLPENLITDPEFITKMLKLYPGIYTHLDEGFRVTQRMNTLTTPYTPIFPGTVEPNIMVYKSGDALYGYSNNELETAELKLKLLLTYLTNSPTVRNVLFINLDAGTFDLNPKFKLEDDVYTMKNFRKWVKLDVGEGKADIRLTSKYEDRPMNVYNIEEVRDAIKRRDETITLNSPYLMDIRTASDIMYTRHRSEKAICASFGDRVKYIHVPVQDIDDAITKDTLKHVRSAFDTNLKNHESDPQDMVVVHCSAGLGRSPVIVALHYFMYHAIDPAGFVQYIEQEAYEFNSIEAVDMFNRYRDDLLEVAAMEPFTEPYPIVPVSLSL